MPNELLKREEIDDILTQLKTKKTLQAINRYLKDKINLQEFFSSDKEIKQFFDYCQHPAQILETRAIRSWGDIQTPFTLVRAIYRFLWSTGFYPEIIIEPTFGDGNFLLPALEFYPEVEHIFGVEIQPHHRWNALLQLLSYFSQKPKPKTVFHLFAGDFFTHSFKDELFYAKGKKVLLIGNPPWVTTAELGKLGGNMRPIKRNYKGVSGISAITGKSNFDITEAIIHHLLNQFAGFSGKMAFLCKNTVIRNILKFLPKATYELSSLQALKIDTKAIFGRTVEASLFLGSLSPGRKERYCHIGKFSGEQLSIERKIGWVDDLFVSNIDQYLKVRNFDGKSPFEWRQGVKHDCSSILELIFEPKTNKYTNKLGEQLELEEEYLFPLVKGSSLKVFEIQSVSRFLLLPQKNLTDTAIQEKCPKSWSYLLRHKSLFEQRKSRVYRQKAPFTIFGIGNYSFKKYKIAKGGMNKRFIFTLVPPIFHKPVLFDDTCYFLGFDSYAEALLICTVLNSTIAQEFLKTIIELDSKRPFTKEALMRPDLLKLLATLPLEEYPKIWKQNNFHFTGDLTKLQEVREQLLSTSNNLLN